MTTTEDQEMLAEEAEIEFGKTPLKGLEIPDEEPDEFEFGPVKTPASSQYAVPEDADFAAGEFMGESGLTLMGAGLVATKKNLAHLKLLDIHYYWKKKGGASNGTPTIGKTQKSSGLLREYSGTDFIIWLAADHCRGMSKHQVEAALFRQLCAAGRDNDGNRVILPPDFTDYLAVVREYGLVTPELRSAGQTMKQLGLGL